VPVPEVVTDIAAGRTVVAVWINELGGVTFAVDGGCEYVKVAPPEWAHHLVAEAARLHWAAAYVRAPRVIGSGDGPPQAGGAPRWLHTAGLPGRSAVDPRWVADPRTAARAIGAGLRMLHDALPVDDCPFGPPLWVTDSLPADRLVICHGDACAPNTLIDDDGRLRARRPRRPRRRRSLGRPGGGHAVAVVELRRLTEGDLFDAYGVEPDATRIAYYRGLWNADDISSR
jgi:kanamycin kinase